MRLSEETKNLLTQLSAKPSKFVLTNLLKQITQDRLISILEQFWENLYPKPTDRDVARKVHLCVSQAVNGLWERATANKSRMTRSDYKAFIIDMRYTISGTFPDELDQRRKTFCEQMIASLPWEVLLKLWIWVVKINNETVLRRNMESAPN